MAVEKEVGIIVTGEDRNASAVLKKVGAEGSKNMEKLKGTVKAMPEQFGKMSGALLLFQSGMGQTGGKVADAANKISALVGLVAVGGPLGIGIAAVTAAVAGASAVWEAYTADAKAAEAAQRSIDKALATSTDRLIEMKNNITALSDEIRFYGAKSFDVAVTKQREMISANEAGVASIQKEIEAIEWTTRAFSKRNSEEMRHLENLIKIRDNATAMLSTRKKELEQLEELARLNKQDLERQERKKKNSERERKESEKRRAEIQRYNTMLRLQATIDQGLSDQRMANITRVAAAEDSETARKDAELERQFNEWWAREDAKRSKTQEITSAIASSWGSAISSIISGQQDAKSAITSAAISTAETVIMTAAASAAAKQFEGAAGLGPGIGIIVGATLASAIFAAVRAYMTKFAFGGVVTGGQPNTDSVPALLTPGERVLTRRERVEYESGQRQPQIVQNITVAPNYSLMSAPSSKAQRRQLILDLSGDMEEAARDGQLRLATVGS